MLRAYLHNHPDHLPLNSSNPPDIGHSVYQSHTSYRYIYRQQGPMCHRHGSHILHRTGNQKGHNHTLQKIFFNCYMVIQQNFEQLSLSLLAKTLVIY